MVAQRCSRRAVHDVLGIYGWVAAMSSDRHRHGSLLGYLDTYLHGHNLVGALVALPSIQCLWPWPS
jgi:hypothetical protein